MKFTVLGRARPRWLVLSALAVLTPLVVYSAIDTGIFEIDGNAITTSTDDWDRVANDTSNGAPAVFLVDTVPPAADRIFIGGGSKDERDISGSNAWAHTDGTPPDKNDIEHAFASAYHNNNGELLIYFGADRYSNSGDSAVGFWFFKDNVSTKADGTFNGKHVVGDVLITSDFRNGGGVSVINVYEWMGGRNPLRLLASGSPAQPGASTTPSCLQKSGVDVACAIANRTATDVPGVWPGGYVFKGGGNNGKFPLSTLFEGGINISQLLGTSQTCFSSFMAMTRTSASTTAQLKDFVVGEFPLCGISVAKSCDGATTVADGGDAFHNTFTVSITNTGTGPVHNASFIEKPTLDSDYACKLTAINDVALSTPRVLATDTPQRLAITLASQAVVTGTVECDTLDNPFDNSVTAEAYASDPQSDPNALKLTADQASADPQCPVFETKGALLISKTCANRYDGDGNLLTPAVTMDKNLIAKVCVDITVSNDSTQRVTGIAINDDMVASANLPDPFSLEAKGSATGTSMTFTDLCYTPATGDDPDETIPHLITFTDHASATGTGALDAKAVSSSTTSATCPLCKDE
jgi:hypothetical protein